MDASDYLLGSDVLGAADAQSRFSAAVSYVASEVAASLGRGSGNTVDLYAAQIKTEPFNNDLQRIATRWKAADDEATRLVIARDAELLADRVQENLPGASQARTRTNLTNKAGIVPNEPFGDGYAQAPPAQAETTYWDEIKKQGTSLKPEWKWPWWGTALIVGGVVVLGVVVLTPIVMPLLVAKAGRTQIVVHRGRGR